MLSVSVTLAEWVGAQDGTIWIVRDGEDCGCSSDGGTSLWDDFPTYCHDCHDIGTAPPVEFAQCAPDCQVQLFLIDGNPVVVGRGRIVGVAEPTDDGKWALRVQVD